MKKKVAILTRRAGYNMGSSLQAYAMAKFIEKEGYDVTILDYDEYARFLLWRIKPAVNRVIYSLLKVCSPLSKIIFKGKYTSLERAETQRKRFEEFENSYLNVSKERYKQPEDFKATLHKYDAYVCGSDQIWSPTMFDPVFMLDFASDAHSGVKTVAYAPSIGVTKAEHISQAQQEMIKKVDFVSCREMEGAAALSDITGSEVPVTLDPTLMLKREDWESMSSGREANNGEDYILTYFLHTKYYVDNTPNKFIAELKQKTGLPIINIQMFNITQLVEADKHIYDANPADFISFISKATYVCTNSFHCGVFSFQLNKKFFVFERFRAIGEKNENQNPRIHTLLKMIDTQESLIKGESQPPNIGKVKDYANGIKSVEKQRIASLSYLINALEQTKEIT